MQLISLLSILPMVLTAVSGEKQHSSGSSLLQCSIGKGKMVAKYVYSNSNWFSWDNDVKYACVPFAMPNKPDPKYCSVGFKQVCVPEVDKPDAGEMGTYDLVDSSNAFEQGSLISADNARPAEDAIECPKGMSYVVCVSVKGLGDSNASLPSAQPHKPPVHVTRVVPMIPREVSTTSISSSSDDSGDGWVPGITSPPIDESDDSGEHLMTTVTVTTTVTVHDMVTVTMASKPTSDESGNAEAEDGSDDSSNSMDQGQGMENPLPSSSSHSMSRKKHHHHHHKKHVEEESGDDSEMQRPSERKPSKKHHQNHHKKPIAMSGSDDSESDKEDSPDSSSDSFKGSSDESSLSDMESGNSSSDDSSSSSNNQFQSEGSDSDDVTDAIVSDGDGTDQGETQ